MARDLLLTLDRDAAQTLRGQLESGLRDGIRSGRLKPGEALPSTRALATDLGVSRGLVVEAFEQLVAEGYLTALHGSRTVVAEVPGVCPAKASSVSPATRMPLDFRPGMPDTSLVSKSRWLHHLRSAFESLGAQGWHYGDPAGLPSLRRGLAAYLGRVRGVVADPDRIVICPGFAGAVSLLAQLLAQRGHTSMAVENPGSVEVHPILRRAGIEPRPMRVDAHGIDAELVARAGTRLALLTPAHQFPTGVVLAASRRGALVAWAREVSGLLVEDDYDAEYRYDREPVGATQGLAPDHVVYAGSLSKTLAPALRLGWLVLPRELVADAVELRRQFDLGNPTLPQAAFASMLDSGDYDRHLRRARRLYRVRRDRVMAVLGRKPLRLSLSGAAAGLHLVAELPSPLTEAQVIAAAAERGVGLYGMSQYRVGPRARAPQALVLGYGSLDDRQLARGLRLIAGILDA